MSSDLYRLPPALRQALEANLQSGERVLWAGQSSWRAAWGVVAGSLLFGLGWSAISLFFLWHMMMAVAGIEPFKFNGHPASQWMAAAFLPFLVPFLAIGGWCLWWPLRAITGAVASVHAVTDRRLISVECGRRSVESYPLGAVNFARRKDLSDGKGTLVIGYGVDRDSDGDPRSLTMTWAGVPDVARAEAAILGQGERR